ncbi:hypothetical protein TanjilG_11125 [Lupinus angustifolius]|uniref:QWRF motif-containing protein n=1 Tax=Lupinus angustifolius TaxID=3871 RepID=A0A394DAD0_LUPAN|nr:hypothetical protein TanjilG_11125 [Lupinus angustifolius]
MEKTNRTVRNQVTVVQPLPRLVRSNSGSSSALITTSDKTSRRFSTSERFINGHRSKSTSRVRTGNDEDKKSKDSFGKFLQRGVSPDNNNIGASKRITSTMKSPSAWALSPGRSLGPPIVSEPVKKASGGGGGGRVGGGVSKVLKYFKQRKISSVQIDEYHRFKILHNRVLQWRFINARAEVATATVNNVAKVDIDSFYEAMNTAVEVMANIEPLITKHQRQVEKILYQVTELITASKQEEEYLQELVEVIPTITALLENEKGIRVHLIQTKMESNSMDHPYNIG